MKKLFIFDLDGTVAAVGESSKKSTNEKIKKLEEKGNLVAFSSGKPTFYLCGFARQMGLKEPILIGENGADIVFGVDLPPRRTFTQFVPESALLSLEVIKKKLAEKFGDRLWFQPNKLECTPFFRFSEDVPEIEKVIKENLTDEIVYIVHKDCFDIQYKEISKGNGLCSLSEMVGITPENMISVGDYKNDYPMFEFTKFSVGINLPDPEKATFNFHDIDEALDFLLENF